MEIKCWRRTSRISRVERKTNIEIKIQLNVETGIPTKIDERSLKKFGHVEWIIDNRLHKIMLH